MMTVHTLPLDASKKTITDFNEALKTFCLDNLVVAAGATDMNGVLLVTLTSVSEDDLPEDAEIPTVLVRVGVFDSSDAPAMSEKMSTWLGDSIGVTYHKAGESILVVAVEHILETEEDEE